LIKNHEKINEIDIKKNQLDEIFIKIQEKLLTKIEFDMFTEKFKPINDSLKTDHPKIYEILNEKVNPTYEIFRMKEIINKVSEDNSLSFLKACFTITEAEQNKINDLLVKINEFKIELEPVIVKNKSKKTKKI
jgi:hypothetical protein